MSVPLIPNHVVTAPSLTVTITAVIVLVVTAPSLTVTITAVIMLVVTASSLTVTITAVNAPIVHHLNLSHGCLRV